MTPLPTTAGQKTEPQPFAETGLAELGIAPGDAVRFRRRDAERWKEATVARREKDGSLGLHDAKGAARAIAVHLIEVRTTGPRGGTVWESLAERAARTEQMKMVDAARVPLLPTTPARHDPELAPASDATAAGQTDPAGTAATLDGPFGEQLRLL
jgi:hypothetical protein